MQQNARLVSARLYMIAIICSGALALRTHWVRSRRMRMHGFNQRLMEIAGAARTDGGVQELLDRKHQLMDMLEEVVNDLESERVSQDEFEHFSFTWQAVDALVRDRLVLLGELRRGALQEYFATAEAELRFWSTSDTIVASQQRLINIYSAGAPGEVAGRVRDAYTVNNPNPQGYLHNLDGARDGSAFSELHAELHSRVRLFVTQRGYYDLFLIGPQGDVYYTVEKEADFTSNLATGPWKDSGLARVFEHARREQVSRTVAVSDMRAYGPSSGAPAIFMATALHDDSGRFLGVMALQLPTDRILGIMAYTSGMGETGETYLVGQDLLMRSDSRFSDESTVLRQAVDTPTVQAALAGDQGAAFTLDYRGVEVLSSYLPMEVGDARWAVMAEIDSEEVELIAAMMRPSIAGALLFIYGLAIWSVWYWRGRQLPDSGMQLADIEMPDSDGTGLGG